MRVKDRNGMIVSGANVRKRLDREDKYGKNNANLEIQTFVLVLRYSLSDSYLDYRL